MLFAAASTSPGVRQHTSRHIPEFCPARNPVCDCPSLILVRWARSAPTSGSMRGWRCSLRRLSTALLLRMTATAMSLLCAAWVVAQEQLQLPPAPWLPYAVLGKSFSSNAPGATSLQLQQQQPVRVAFIADLDLRRGTPAGARGHALLRLIALEGANATVLSGDLDYMQLALEGRPNLARRARRNYPALFFAAVDAELGPEHPVFVALGNHDLDSGVAFAAQQPFPHEPTYAQLYWNRLHTQGLTSTCQGHAGADLACSFHGLLLLSSGVAVVDEPAYLVARRAQHEEFVSAQLAAHARSTPWRICHWHTPAAAFNTGAMPKRGARDDPGLRMYQACLRRGGLIATGHEHAYARSKPLGAFDARGEKIQINDGPPFHYPPTAQRRELIVLVDGSSSEGAVNPDSLNGVHDVLRSSGLLFHNGLGGHSARLPFGKKGLAPWWGKLHNGTGVPAAASGISDGDKVHEDTGLRYTGALFCDFFSPPTDTLGALLSLSAFMRLYQLPSIIRRRITDLSRQSTRCFFKTASGHVSDEFQLLSVAVKPFSRAAPLEQVGEAGDLEGIVAGSEQTDTAALLVTAPFVQPTAVFLFATGCLVVVLAVGLRLACCFHRGVKPNLNPKLAVHCCEVHRRLTSLVRSLRHHAHQSPH